MPIPLLRRRMLWWHVLVLASGTATITWSLLSLAKGHGPFYVSGPYHVPLIAERLVGAATLTGSVAVVRDLDRRTGTAVRGVSFAAAAVLLATSAFLTFLWRLATGRGEGANIGAGFMLLIGPLIVAGLLIGCVCIERSNGGLRSGFARWIVLAASTGPLGIVAMDAFL